MGWGRGRGRVRKFDVRCEGGNCLSVCLFVCWEKCVGGDRMGFEGSKQASGRVNKHVSNGMEWNGTAVGKEGVFFFLA